MSIRVDNNADLVRRTANLPANLNSYTMAAWVKRVVTNAGTDRSVLDAITGVGHYAAVEFTSGNAFQVAASDSSGGLTDVFSVQPATGDWFYVAISGNASTGVTGRWWNAAGVLQDTGNCDFVASYSEVPTNINFLNNGAANQHLNGVVAYGRLWDVELTQVELEAEMVSRRPVKTTNLNTAFHGFDGSGADISGNGRNWTTTGTASDTDMPSLPTGVAFIQQFGGASAASATSSGNVTSGNVLAVAVYWLPNSITLNSISNNRGPDLTLYDNPTAESGNAGRSALAVGALTSGGATCTLTCNFSGAESIGAILAHEYSGVDLAQIVDNAGLAHAMLDQQNQGTGTDAVDSGSFTTVTDNCMIFGAVLDVNFNNDMSPGTGYTGRITTQTSALRGDTEDKIKTPAGSVTATFTCSSAFRSVVVGGLALKPTGVSVTYYPTRFIS